MERFESGDGPPSPLSSSSKIHETYSSRRLTAATSEARARRSGSCCCCCMQLRGGGMLGDAGEPGADETGAATRLARSAGEHGRAGTALLRGSS